MTIRLGFVQAESNSQMVVNNLVRVEVLENCHTILNKYTFTSRAANTSQMSLGCKKIALQKAKSAWILVLGQACNKLIDSGSGVPRFGHENLQNACGLSNVKFRGFRARNRADSYRRRTSANPLQLQHTRHFHGFSVTLRIEEWYQHLFRSKVSQRQEMSWSLVFISQL